MHFFGKEKEKTFVAAVVVAAGSGTRMGTDTPKQFLEVGGKPVLAYTLEKFQNNPRISEIVVVTREDSIVVCKDIADIWGISKLSVITVGGTTRQESVKNGISQLSQSDGYVLIHDGARPLVSDAAIDACIDSVIENRAAAIGVKVKDTVKYSADGKFIAKTVDRSRLWLIQTPQAFDIQLICECHKKAVYEGFEATDDCMLAEHYGIKVALVEGEYENIKITSPSDIYVMEGLLDL